MKILTFTSLFPNRVKPNHGIFIFQRMQHLARRNGNTIKVVAPITYLPRFLRNNPKRGWVTGVPARELRGDLETFHPRYFLLPHLMPAHGSLMYLGALRQVVQLHQQEHFDCIDAHFVYPDGFAAALLAERLKVPLFLSARGTDINLFPDFRTVRPMIRWSLNKAAGIIAVSEGLKERMIRLGADTARLKMIGNGVDVERFFLMAREEARSRLGVPADSHILVSVANLVAAKGHLLLVEALARLKNEFPALRLYLVGEGTSRPDIERAINRLGIADRVTLVGAKPNDELKYWFNAADLSCLMSQREGWPNVILESLACGTPVLAADIPGIRELLTPQLGQVVPREVGYVANGLRSALSHVWDRPAMAAFARTRTWDRVAEELESFMLARLQAVAR